MLAEFVLKSKSEAFIDYSGAGDANYSELCEDLGCERNECSYSELFMQAWDMVSQFLKMKEQISSIR